MIQNVWKQENTLLYVHATSFMKLTWYYMFDMENNFLLWNDLETLMLISI